MAARNGLSNRAMGGGRRAANVHRFGQHRIIFALIATNPQMARERGELSPPLRIHPFKSHLIVYRIEDDGDILIVRVRRGHEDWSSGAAG